MYVREFKFIHFISCLDKLTNYGKKFIIGFTAQYYFYNRGYIGIAMVAHFDTNVTITTTKTSSKPLNVTLHMKEGDSLEYPLPLSLRMVGRQYNGVQISSTMDISVMCLNYESTYGGDGYLALPTPALGITYVVASYRPYDGYSKAKLGIVSAHDGNNILIRVNKNAVIVYGGISYEHGSPFQVSLGKLQTVQVVSTSDLSGTIISSSKPVSVVSSVDRARPGTSGNIDRVESILLPVSQWGREYILTTVGSMNKKQGDIFRIFAYENETVVKTAYWTKVLLFGTYAELILGKNLTSFVNCSKPCQVVHYIRGETIGGKNADTSMTVLPSINQFLSYYRVVSTYGSSFDSSITIAIKEDYTNGLYFDGVKMANLSWVKIAGTGYVWTVVGAPVTKIATFYHLSPEVSFGLFVFGWDGAVSYAYPGGFGFEHHITGMYFK